MSSGGDLLLSDLTSPRCESPTCGRREAWQRDTPAVWVCAVWVSVLPQDYRQTVVNYPESLVFTRARERFSLRLLSQLVSIGSLYPGNTNQKYSAK